MTGDILLIHNAVDDEIATEGKVAFRESNIALIVEAATVTDALETLGIKYQTKIIKTLEQLPDILIRNNRGIVFNLVEELPSSILHACYVPAVCRAHSWACTGNDTPALILAQNKWQTKAVLRAANVPTPDGAIVPVGQKTSLKHLPRGKYVVKPVFSDASEGIDADSIVELPSEALSKAIKRIHERFNQPAIVEQFIPNRELNVSLLQQNGEVKILPIAEIDFSAFDMDRPRIVDYSAKWEVGSFAYNHTPQIIPAQISEKASELVRQYALAAWNATGCQDYTRVDFRMDDNEQVFVLEVNPNPDISPDAGFAAVLTAAGISYERFIEILLDNASMRSSCESLF
jgi:D-alanine-D-alanine ligase